jgi:curved DNA-binding protein CbpA
VPQKTHYDVLEVGAAAPADEIKRAFRALIARYHPDKVQHLGREFQDMAAERAAELTEAYRVLSDEGRRGDYDRALSAGAAAPAAQRPAAAAAPPSASYQPAEPAAPSPPVERNAEADPSRGAQFTHERASRDQFVRKATVGRVRQALEGLDGYDEASIDGFDFAIAPKATFFGRGKGPRLLGKFVARVDRESVAATWAQAARATIPASEDVCIFLMGSSLAPPRELAEAITEQRRKARSTRVTVVPIDGRNWDAHMPVDAPAVAKDLLARLKKGS